MNFRRPTPELSFVTYIRLYVIFFMAIFLHRLAFWWSYASGTMSGSEVLKSWWLGLRFDVRLVSLFFLISFIVFIVTSPIFKVLNRKNLFYLMQKLWFGLGLGFFVICTWVDFGYYSYLGERLSSKIFALLSNPSIALGMVVQSYPIALIGLGFVCLALVIYFLISKVGFVFKEQMFFYSQPIRPLYLSALKYFSIFLLLAISIHSKFSQYPLRWSEAYFSSNSFLNQFALNPLQNTFDTYKFNNQSLETKEIKNSLLQVQEDLGMPADPKNLLLVREQSSASPVLPEDTNVVVIMMESLASFKLGHFNNPFDTTPHLDSLIKKGLFFNNFHVVQSGTAASIFCFITGTPDLNEEETASRNPLVVDQHTMINNLKDHSKYYFIGGSANWGNIRGIIQNNIQGVKLYEEGMFKQARLNDIWGISDLALFEESHKILEKAKKPFFAFIQTAGYHKPYTIPSRTEGFEYKTLTEEQIKKYGYFSNEEYNSLRFSDHALGHYLKLAKESDYFKNTVFVIYADHGLRAYESETLSPFYSQHKFPVYHIPLLIYSPSLPEELQGEVQPTLSYEPDILPTLLAMMGVSGPNSTFGLDLLSEQAQNRSGIFLRGNGAYPVRFFDGERVVYSSLNQKDQIKAFQTENFVEQLYHSENASEFENKELDLNSLAPEDLADVKEKASLGRAYYKSILYKLRNNQKDKVQNFWQSEKERQMEETLENPQAKPETRPEKAKKS